MPITWPQNFSGSTGVSEILVSVGKSQIEKFALLVEAGLAAMGLPPTASPLFRPWNFIGVRDSTGYHVVLSELQGGFPVFAWAEQPDGGGPIDRDTMGEWARQNQGWTVILTEFWVPLPERPQADAELAASATRHVAEIEKARSLGRLGDLTGVTHLEPYLRQFLDAHSDYERNVFVMMSFRPSDQLTAAFAAIKRTLAARGLHAVRADDRDYTGELWSNVEVYLTCSKYGIAIYEQIDSRDFNPNVALELGYMLARRKRCLILKEQRLSDLPVDVMHRLYKTWDSFKIKDSIGREVGRWVDVDLGIGSV